MGRCNNWGYDEGCQAQWHSIARRMLRGRSPVVGVGVLRLRRTIRNESSCSAQHDTRIKGQRLPPQLLAPRGVPQRAFVGQVDLAGYQMVVVDASSGRVARSGIY